MNAAELKLMKQAVQYIENFIAIKPACEIIGIDYRKQLNFIKSDEIMGQLCTLRDTVGSDNRKREMLCVPKHAFLMWIYRIETNRVKNTEAREKLILMKRVIHEYVNKSEQLTLAYETYIDKLKSLDEQLQQEKNAIATSNRNMKQIFKAKKILLDNDPRQMAFEFKEEPKQLNS